MPAGGGKYQDLTVNAMLETDADAAVVIIVNGNKGDGLGMATCNPSLIGKIPEILRMVALQIEEQNKTEMPEITTMNKH